MTARADPKIKNAFLLIHFVVKQRSLQYFPILREALRPPCSNLLFLLRSVLSPFLVLQPLLSKDGTLLSLRAGTAPGGCVACTFTGELRDLAFCQRDAVREKCLVERRGARLLLCFRQAGVSTGLLRGAGAARERRMHVARE